MRQALKTGVAAALSLLSAAAGPGQAETEAEAFLAGLGTRYDSAEVEVEIDLCQVTTRVAVQDGAFVLETNLPLDLVTAPAGWTRAEPGEVPGLMPGEVAVVLTPRDAALPALEGAVARVAQWKSQEEARLARIHETSRGRLVHSPVLAADWAAFSTRSVARIRLGELGREAAAILTVLYGTGEPRPVIDFGLSLPLIVVLPEGQAADLADILGGVQEEGCPPE